MIAAAAASGAMAAVTLPAFADSTAAGIEAGSPGVVSGNGIQLPVHLPVNLCGNTVNVVGALNPAMGNACANRGAGARIAPAAGPTGQAGSGTRAGSATQAGSTSHGGASAHGETAGSPGVVSGNGVQAPVRLPVNVSGNSGNIVGIGNPVFGNESVNAPGEKPVHPAAPTPESPKNHSSAPEPEPQRPGHRTVPPATMPHTPAASRPVARPAARSAAASSLAVTGAEAALSALAGSTAMMLGGALLYRRFRPGAQG